MHGPCRQMLSSLPQSKTIEHILWNFDVTIVFCAWIAIEYITLSVAPLQWKAVLLEDKWMFKNANKCVGDVIRLTCIYFLWKNNEKQPFMATIWEGYQLLHRNWLCRFLLGLAFLGNMVILLRTKPKQTC